MYRPDKKKSKRKKEIKKKKWRGRVLQQY